MVLTCVLSLKTWPKVKELQGEIPVGSRSRAEAGVLCLPASHPTPRRTTPEQRTRPGSLAN